jgi:phosphotransferase system  glucose/maltose/N-acetylglucosamine-specific IIC component
MTIFRKAYSVFGAILMLQFVLQLYFIAAAIFTFAGANDNAKDVYAAFKNSDSFFGLHAINGDLVGINLLIMLALSFASRYPWRTTILTGVLFVLLVIQLVLAHTGIALLSALHGINALILIGLGGFLTGRNWAFRRGPVETAQGAASG